MKVSDILSKDCVFAQLEQESKKDLLQMMSVRAAQKSETDEHVVADSVWERESLGSTGYGCGTAFPHARIDGLEKVCGVFAQLKKPIAFESSDHKPVDLVFLLISPENSGADHLSALAEISRVLKDENICRQLREARTSDEIYRVLNQTL
jgi:PTS system nitrogen regulatory IIA component